MDNYGGSEHVLRRTRRIACDVCRERKVRCDRGQPSCERCIRLGNKCAYTYTVWRKKSNANSVNVQELLMQMHSRLARAEDQLAKGQLPDTHFDFNNPISGRFSDDGMQTDTQDPLRYFPHNTPPGPLTESNSVPSSNSGSSSTASPKDQTESNNRSDPDAALWERWAQDSAFDEFGDPLTNNFMAPLPDLNMTDICSVPGSAGVSNTEPTVDEPSLSYFHQCYFDTVNNVLPMVNRERFEAEIRNMNSKHEFNALKYAVAMVGAASCDDQHQAAEICYRQARTEIEKAEREDAGEQFLTLRSVQTLLLVIFYEFKKKSLARTWMTIGRAMRLAKVMELDHLDRDGTSDCQPGFQLPLPPTNDLVEMEERRNTFWVAFIIDAYVSVRTGCSTAFDRLEVSTYLPTAELGLAVPLLQPRFRLLDAVTNPARLPTPTPFCGLTIMTGLASMIIKHVQTGGKKGRSIQDSSYPFWNEHFRLDGTISNVLSTLLDPTTQTPYFPDVRQQLVNLNLRAVDIYFHELAIKRAEWDQNIPATLISESHRRSDAAVMEIVATLRQARDLGPDQSKIFKQMNTFTMWSLSVAAGALIRMLGPAKDPSAARNALAGLQVLQSTIIDLEDESASFGTLLEDVVMQLNLWESTLVSPAPSNLNEFFS